MRAKKLKTTSDTQTNGTNEPEINDNNSGLTTTDETLSDESITDNNNTLNVDQLVTNSAMDLNYRPKLFLRCHCKRDDPFDNSTPIWSAAFLPKTDDESDDNRFVATCGANMVCIIDCHKSIENCEKSVIARYCDSNKDEEFVSLAWSVVPIESQPDKQTLVLAIGGKSSIIFLSDLNGFHCYERRPDAHSDTINALLFTQNDYLFSASYDKRIKLWKISRPDDNNTIQLMKTIETKDFLLSLSFSHKYQTLISSSIKGVYFWANVFDSTDPKESPNLAKIKSKNLVDGLHLIPEDEDAVALRVHLSKVITIVDLKKVMTHFNNSSDNKSEMKSISLSKVVKGKVRSFDFLYPFIYLSAQKNLLASGGPNGQIWLYNTNRFDEYYKDNKIGKPDKVLEWPQVENISKDNRMIIDDKKPVIVNMVAISPNLQFLVALTQINLLCIWQKS